MNKKEALEEYLGEPVKEYDYEEYGLSTFETESNEVYVVGTYDECLYAAKKEIENIFDDVGFEAYSDEFKNQILEYHDYINWDKADELYKEDLEEVTNNMTSEELAEELGKEDYEKAWENYFYEDLVDEYVNKMIDNWADAIEYFEDMLGSDKTLEFLANNDALDLDEMYDSVIASDGIANSLARYDGKEIALSGDLFAYRVE